MSWIRKQIERLLAEARRRSRLLTGGVVAAVAAALVVTIALAQGATAASTDASGDAERGQSVLELMEASADEQNGPLNPDKGSLTSAKFYVEGPGGTSSVSGAVAANSRVQFQLTFEVGPNVLSENDKTITYTLPWGIDAQSSQLTNKNIAGINNLSGKSLGSWDIVKNGDDTNIVMTFSEGEVRNLFSQGLGTTLTFWATVQNDSVTESKTFSFNGVGELVVNPMDASISVSKSAVKKTDGAGADLADGEGYRNRHADYTVVVSSTNGTGDKVTITDRFTVGQSNVSSASYDQGSFTLVKYASAGDSAGQAMPFDPSQLVMGSNSFTLSGLDALAAGELYELKYSATITEIDHTADTYARNDVEARVENGASSTGSATAQWTNHGDIHLSKTGQLLDDVVDESDPNLKRVRYTLKVWSEGGTITRIQIGDGVKTEDTQNLDLSDLSTRGFFEKNSFSLWRYPSTAAADSGTNGVDEGAYIKGGLSIGRDGSKPSMGLAIPRPLEAGECYILSYTALVRMADLNAPNSRVNNQAIARIYPGGVERNTGQVNAPIEWHNDIQKVGNFNSDTGFIDWTIDVNRNHGDARGIEVIDNLPEGLCLVSNVRITGGNVNRTLDLLNGPQDGSSYDAETRRLSVKLGDWASQNVTYTIKFSTTAPQDGTVSNQAYEIKNGVTYGSQLVGPGTIRRQTEWGLEKTGGNSNFDATTGLYTLTWNASVTFKDEALSPDGENGVLVLHDQIDEVTAAGVSSSDFVGLHYAVAKDLYADLTGSGSAQVTLSLHNDADQDGNARTYTLSNGSFSWGSGEQKVTLDGVRLVPTFYDAAGNKIDDPSNSESHVKRFDVVLTCNDGQTINGRKLEIRGYRTVVDASKLPASSQVDVTNALALNRGNLSSPSTQHFTTLSSPLEKKVRTLDGRADNDDTGFAEKTKFEADWKDTESGDFDGMSDGQHAAQFRIALNTTDYPDGVVTVTDTLPSGMVLATSVKNSSGNPVPHKVRLVWGQNVGSERASYEAINNVLTYSTHTDGDHQVVTFSFDPLRTGKGKGQYYITYTASYLGDVAWQSLSTSSRSYVNTVTATVANKTYSDFSTLNITRQVSKVAKSVDGTLTNDRRGKYRVVINPAGSDLNPGSDSVELLDELTATGTHGWNSSVGHMNPDLDLSTVHLYQYNPNASDGLGPELDKSRYSLAYEHADGDAGFRRMRVTVPDSMPLVLVYQYEFKAGAMGDWGGETSTSKMVGNTATLAGESSGELAEEIRMSGSGATGYTQAIYLYKVDAANNAKTLTGSKFDLYEYGASDGTDSWVPKQRDIEGGHDDKSAYAPQMIPLIGDNVVLEHNKLFKLVETTAPTGYGKTVKYFVWLGEGQSEDDAWKAIIGSEEVSADATIPNVDADGNSAGSSISRSMVSFIPSSGGNLYVADEYQSVTVTKNWVSTDGVTPVASDSPDLPKDIKLQLKQGVEGSSTWSNYGDAVTVSKDEQGHWQCTWNNLPQTDANNGQKYVYKVEEVGSDSHWKATYLNNDGISTGNITITNVRQYSLPSTGGIPLRVLTAVGTATALIAGALLAIRHVARH